MELNIIEVGRQAFEQTLALQLDWVARIARQPNEVTLLWAEHAPAVVTLGRATLPQHVQPAKSWLERRGVRCVRVARGGSVTWHGPGQWVGYVVMDLRRANWTLREYLRRLEQAWLNALSDFGVAGCRIPGRTGVWVSGEKLVSIGIAVKRWITYYGFSINVNPDMEVFEYITPCGLDGVRMTSLHALGVHQTADVKTAFENHWRKMLTEACEERIVE